jgi:hypothetical protein
MSLASFEQAEEVRALAKRMFDDEHPSDLRLYGYRPSIDRLWEHLRQEYYERAFQELKRYYRRQGEQPDSAAREPQ